MSLIEYRPSIGGEAARQHVVIRLASHREFCEAGKLCLEKEKQKNADGSDRLKTLKETQGELESSG